MDGVARRVHVAAPFICLLAGYGQQHLAGGRAAKLRETADA